MRIWNGREKDDGSVHCLGNGRMCAYGCGPDIIQLFGPPYSAPNLIQLLFDNEELVVESQRIPDTSIWKHKVSGNGQNEMLDLVDTELVCFARRLAFEDTLHLCVKTLAGSAIIPNQEGFLVYLPAGGFIYNDYPLPRKVYFQVILCGNIAKTSICDTTADLEIKPGISHIYIVGGSDYRECLQNTHQIVAAGFEGIYSRTVRGWQQFSKKRHDFNTLLDEGVPFRQKLLEIIDSVSVLIKAQQAEEGGILAGYNYHLGYVRDQYGVFRCLLKLGLFQEARDVLSFYWNVFKHSGKIHNAQALGVPGIFHVHENDEVEITGYLLLKAFKYAEVTKDEEFLEEMLPMLEWANESQKKHLVKGMLPFNGDETYIAGGILPRAVMNDGSAESTLLFITGGAKLIKWLEEKGIWDSPRIEENKRILRETKDLFRKNFLIDGMLAANSPNRKKGLVLPAFRHGVCEGCLDKKEYDSRFLFGWTVKSENDRYLCPKCLAGHYLPRAEDITYFLKSIALMPLYIESDLLSKDEIGRMFEEILEDYAKTGRLPSRSDGNILLGYDYGILLFNLIELSHPMANEIYRKVLSLTDPTDAWVEYYIDDRPFNTRCRPWESGINLEAALHYALNWKPIVGGNTSKTRQSDLL